MKEYFGKILMLVENSFPRDPRVRNEANVLTKAGYKVSVIALNKRKEKKRDEINYVNGHGRCVVAGRGRS